MSNETQQEAPVTDLDINTADDVLTSLNSLDSDDDDIEVVKPESDDEDEPETKDDKDESDNEDDEEEIKLDESTYEEVPKVAELKKAYPDIFKKFPGVRRAIFREAEYSRVFTSIDEAKDAKGRLEDFNHLESEISAGNIEGLLASVKSSNPQAFGKITGKILQTLGRVDKDSYLGAMDHVVRHAIAAAARFAAEDENKEEGEQLMIAAKLINKFFYKTTKIEAPKADVVEAVKDDGGLSKERQEFETGLLQRAVSDVGGRASSTVRKIAEKYIDPQGRLGPYVRNKAVEDVLKQVDQAIGSDGRFRALIDKLWEEAKKNRYNSATTQKIYDNIISKSKSSLPDIIKGVRSSVLKGDKKVVKKKKEDEDDEVEVTRESRRSGTPKTSSTKSPQRARTANEVLDFLNKG